MKMTKELNELVDSVRDRIDLEHVEHFDGSEHGYYVTMRQKGDENSNQMIDVDLLQTDLLSALQYVKFHIGCPDGWIIRLWEVN